MSESRIAYLEHELIKLRIANSAGYRLAANLCFAEVVAEKNGNDLIRRETIMEFVAKWREEIDSANQLQFETKEK